MPAATRATATAGETMKFPFDKSPLGYVSVALNILGLTCFAYGMYAGIHLGSVSSADRPFVRIVIWFSLHIALALTLPVLTAFATVNKSDRALDWLRNSLVALLCVYILDFFVRVVLFTNCTAQSSNAYVDCSLSVSNGLDLAQSITTAVLCIVWIVLTVVCSVLLRRSYSMTLRDAFDAERRGADNRDPVVSDKVPLMSSSSSQRQKPDSSHAQQETKATKKKKKKSRKDGDHSDDDGVPAPVASKKSKKNKKQR
jgi:hypothetical protein